MSARTCAHQWMTTESRLPNDARVRVVSARCIHCSDRWTTKFPPRVNNGKLGGVTKARGAR